MHCFSTTSPIWRTGLTWAILATTLCGAADLAFAQGTASSADPASLELDHEGDSAPKVYTSPQSILSDFFGRRRAGMLVHGTEDLVGIAATGISPLFVLSVTSPTVYFMTEPEQRGSLIFLYQPWFFIPIILMTLLVAFKDTVLTFASYLKKPLDILGILFNVIGFLVGFRLVYHLLDIHLGAEGSVLGTVFSVMILVMMFAFYTSIWVLSNVFEVLILINPFPLVDTVLRVSRIGILLTMYLACWIHPVLGGLIALPILILSLITFERSLRTTLLGLRLAWDVISFRKDKIAQDQTQFSVFSSIGGSLPWMTLGKVVQTDKGLAFHYRRFSIGPTRCIELQDGPYAIAQGSLFPGLMQITDAGSTLIVRFPASYRGQEEALAARFGPAEIRDFRLSTLARSAWKGTWQFCFGSRQKGVTAEEAKPTEDTCSDSLEGETEQSLSPVDQA